MGGGAPSPPPAPDPNSIIQAEEQANRVNQFSPFGSQKYGPNGLTTSLNPQMQNAANLAMKSAGTPLTPLNNTQGFGGLQQQILKNMMARNTPGQGPKMQPTGMNGMAQSGGIPAPYQAALGQIWGINGPQ